MTYIISFDGMKTAVLNDIEWTKDLDLTDKYIRERYASAQQGDQESKEYLLSREDCWVARLYVNDEIWGTIAWSDLPKMSRCINDEMGDKYISLQKIMKNTGIEVNFPEVRRNFAF